MHKPPCYGCTDRVVSCHAECERYLSWVKEQELNKACKAKEEDMYQEYMRVTHRPQRPRNLLRNK